MTRQANGAGERIIVAGPGGMSSGIRSSEKEVRSVNEGRCLGSYEKLNRPKYNRGEDAVRTVGNKREGRRSLMEAWGT